MRLSKSELTQIKNQLATNSSFRTELCSANHQWFFATYFSDYIKYPSPNFHSDLFEITENDEFLSVVVAFRGSAKSTIMALSYPIWAMIGAQKRKHIILISRTKELAGKILQNIRRELENNKLLIQDYGPFIEDSDSWNSERIHIKKYDTSITSLSVNSSKRGLREGSTRPDLIICDDVQDMDSVKTKESRDKTYNWYVNEIVPLGDLGTKMVIIGNLLHDDSLVSKLKEDIENGNRTGLYREYPLMNTEGMSLWPEKYTPEEIEKLQLKVGDVRAFQIEYMLRILPKQGQPIYQEWIQYYDELPPGNPDYVFSGVDLAISQKTSADYTAIVTFYVYGGNQDWTAYVLPNPINKRMTFPEAQDTIIETGMNYLGNHQLIIEANGYQGAMIQTIEARGITCLPFTSTIDKYTKIKLTSAAIKQGLIKFPRKGCKDLITQMVGFGVEKHDDIVDAFSIGALPLITQLNEDPPKISFI
ncbi:MAG: hypothetical protein R3B92_04165 [Patescibacteria group bacterium]